MDIDGSSPDNGGVTPNLGQKLIAAEDTTWFRYEMRKEIELRCRERHLLVTHVDPSLCGVDGDATDRYRLTIAMGQARSAHE
jgi:hypothetical protein